MERSVLPNQSRAVDCDDLPVGKRYGEHLPCHGIVAGLIVDRHDHRTGRDEEIGVCGREPLAVFIIYRIGKGESKQRVGCTCRRDETAQFLLHGVELGRMGVFRVVGFYIKNHSEFC